MSREALALTEMTDETIPYGLEVFRFSLVTFRIKGDSGGFFLRATLLLDNITSAQFFHLADGAQLSAALKLFNGHSSSKTLAEPRASVFADPHVDNGLIAQYSLDEAALAGNSVILAKIDFVYEAKFWFDHYLKTDVFVAFENPFDPIPSRDIFHYYQSKVTGEV